MLPPARETDPLPPPPFSRARATLTPLRSNEKRKAGEEEWIPVIMPESEGDTLEPPFRALGHVGRFPLTPAPQRSHPSPNFSRAL